MTAFPIAIIGAGCHFPGGRDLESFYRFVHDGGCAITDLPADRYDSALYYDAKRGTLGKSYCWRGAMFAADAIATPVVPGWTAERAARLHTLHKLALGVAAETVASAGLTAEQLAGRNVAVLLGGGRPRVESFDHAFVHEIERLVAPLDRAMPDGEGASAVRAEVVRAVRARYASCGDAWSATLGRQVAGVVAAAYRTTGRHAVIDAACGSSLATLSAGARALEQRSADLALVGAASMFDPYTLVFFAMSRSLTGDGSYPFDARASGFIPGEGSGMFLLERLDDALAHGRRILGVIRGIGASCDGAGKGTWAPRREGQVLAIERAYAPGRLELSEVQVIEAHATSTRLGDATEVSALAEVFGRAGRRAPLWIGSVKSNVGHTLSAAGSAGLAKLLGAFREGVIPPSIGYTTPNPDIHWERVPLRLVTAPTPWPADGPRVAAVDSFGIGGINYHVVVEGPPSPARADELVRRSVPAPRARVAIVGAGAWVAGAHSAAELARVAGSATPQSRPLPAARLALELYLHDPPVPWRTSYERAALADDPSPDPQQLKIPPKLIRNYDPLQFMVLDAANQAFGTLRAGVDRQRVAVFVGTSQFSDYLVELTLSVRVAEVARLIDGELAARGIDPAARARIVAAYVDGARLQLPPLTEESSASVASGVSSRTAKTLDVNGPVFTIDSGGTGSGLAAIEAGVDALRSGDCDVAIVGGGDRAVRIDRLAHGCAWDEAIGGGADLPGDGAAVLALRRLDDAVAAGETVIATIAAIGSATGGDLEALRGGDRETVARAIARAFERGDTAAANVRYLITDAFAARDAPDVAALEHYGDGAGDPIPLGSALPLFGNCGGALGVAAVEMAAAALEGGSAPPARELLARVGASRGRLRCSAEPTPLRPGSAAVTSASGWGTHYHVVVERSPASEPAARASSGGAAREPVVLRATSRAALWSALRALRPDDVARLTAGATLGSGEVAVALRGSTIHDSLQVALTAATSAESAAFVAQGVAVSDRPVAGAACFLFPGLGSPYEGMLRAIVDAYPEAARRLAEIDALVVPRTGRTMTDVLHGEPRLFAETVEWAQLASLTANLVTFEVAAAHGFTPAFVSGHSFGEYAALVVAGAITLADAVRMAAARADSIARTTRPGAMASVFATPTRIAELVAGIEGFASASNVNSPDEVVVSADHEGMAAFLERCRRAQVQAKQLSVPAPFHCELLRPACEPFARAIAQIPIARPRIPVISSVTSQEITDPEAIRRALVAQLVEPVDFVAQIEHGYARGARRFIETGAGNVLARLAAKILGKRPAVIVSFDERRKREKTGLTAVENALVVLRASEVPAAAPAGVAASAPAPSASAASAPVAGAPRASLFTTDEWQDLARQPGWAAFWVQARPSLALFARDLYARSQTTSATPPPPRPAVKVFDATAMRGTASSPKPAPVVAPPPAAVAPATTTAPAPVAPRPAAPPSPPPPPAAAAPDRLVDEVSGFLTDLVVKHTGYPRELVRFDQELEADLGIDTVKQVELLGTIRESLDLPADESVTVSDLPTLAQLRDYVVSRLANGAPASPASAPDPSQLAGEVTALLTDLVVQHTGYPRELVRFDQELEADLGIDTVKQVELLGTIRQRLDLSADESVTVSDLPTLAQLRDYVIGRLTSLRRSS